MVDSGRFIAAAWKNGSDGYGLYIGAERARWFERSWTRVTLQLLGGSHPVTVRPRITSTFWTSCPEIRCVVIRRWLRDLGLLTWPDRRPPRFWVTPIGDAEFEVRPMTTVPRE